MASIDTSTVLLISRGTMSGGQMIGDCLAKHAGIRCLTRENLLEAIESYGDLATRITRQIASATEAYEEFSELRRPYRILMKRALLGYARQGKLAYFGYSGHLLLHRVAHFVRIRLIAPLEVRVARTRELLHYSEREAREYIRKVDQERTHWARMMYGLDIRDASLYDLCLNVERLSMNGACDLLREAMRQGDFKPTPESLAQVEEDYLATQVLALLVTDTRTHRLELGAGVSNGTLRLVGPYLPDDDLRVVLSIAESVPGIHGAQYEPGYTSAFQYAS